MTSPSRPRRGICASGWPSPRTRCRRSSRIRSRSRALSPGKRAEVLANAQAAVDQARAELDAVEVAHETSVLNVWNLSDLFTPEDFREASIPEQRRLLSLGIARVVVAKGGRELDGRVRIAWADEIADVGRVA